MTTNRRDDDIIRSWHARLAHALPDGTPVDRAIAALDTLGVEHGPYHADTRSVTGIVRGVRRTATTRTAVQITLRFDDGGALRSRRVEAVRTGT
jgi:hypothetical protein